MTPISASAAKEQPLTTDDLIEERVSALIGRACRRQLWLLFLDAEDVQLPILMPTDDFPVSPLPEYARALARGVSEILEATDAAQVILVWERYAGAELTAGDRAWARQLHDECTESGVRVRAQLLSHKRGVRWIAPEDYR